MDFRQLEAFIATVDHQSFSAAAEALYLSQPTISSYIHSLERELNTQLIRRTTKKFEVTVNGQQLYEYAVALLRLQQKAITELSNTGTKELHIGTSSVPGLCILPRALAGYRKECPEVNAYVTHSDSMDIIQQVENGTLDVGLVGRKTEGNCVFETIATDELVIATPNNAYYREKYGENTDLKGLMKEPFIMRTEQSGTQYEAEQLLQKLGLAEKDLNIVAKVNDAHALQNYVIQGFGISLVSHRMVKAEAQRGKLLVFPLGEYARQRNFYLVFQEGPYLPKSAISFIKYMRELADKKDL